ncbi:GRF zinc finger domain-containing protein [Pseudovirgaria hyperparasitica]|uniref:GRF zinc finger domain-containing protein n=1 Tax=Pseudovirgaria hyperparasitica TaxID=470096 RepID=A0A6A6WFX1_9PEZI|nr:GRF zinc finger domain-containing protein [Pseudovirgaria hyperparasitica]KAF2760031.1 GRF zinc finger domain-containing protein [Pseudovirgaria hyperparasitica]
MDAFVSRKRRRAATPDVVPEACISPPHTDEDDSTDVKLALLASLHPDCPQEALLDALLSHEGSVEDASRALGDDDDDAVVIPGGAIASPRKKEYLWKNGPGYQSSISSFSKQASDGGASPGSMKRLMTRKGRTLHLYAPKDIENHTPCSIIHNFLPSETADALLLELLGDAPTFYKGKFKLFDRVVESPHTFAFYVDSWEDVERQKREYTYNGQELKDVRRLLPEMRSVSKNVEDAVNLEIQRRIRDFQGGHRLRYQSPKEWKPNTAFVNCYDGAAQNVGYHADELTYLGPRAIIGSLSLGVSREFRVRKTIAREDKPLISKPSSHLQDDPEGQIAIHLPHNSLLVMHADMQEEWKHSIAPAQSIDPHPLAGNKRLNITYRCYKDALHPKFTPRCRCGIPTVLRCVQKRKESRGRYMWMCHAHFAPDKEGCSFFQWAEFDDDGEPPWSAAYKQRAAKPAVGQSAPTDAVQ